MDFSEILPALTQVAPVVAGLLGGPLASMGVQTLEGVFGLAPGTAETNPAALVTAVAGMTPDEAVQLAKIDADLKGKLSDAGIALASVDAGDRASARTREESVKDFTPRILAAGITFGFFGLLTFLVFRQVPEASHDIIIAMIGTLGAGWISVVAYYFGSSSSSKVKDDTISTLSKP
jgi:hypothetical protein